MLARMRASGSLRSLGASRLRPCRPIAQLVQHYGPAGDSPEVLVFGDSVMNHTSRHDVSTVPLGPMVMARLAPRHRTCVVAESGYHPEVFRLLTEVLMTLPQRPKLVILALNIRSFSPQWDLNPDWQHHDIIDAANRFLARPSLDVPMTRAIRQSEADRARYLATVVSCPGRPQATIADYVRRIATRTDDPEAALERSRDIFAFHYLSTTVNPSRRVHSVRALLGTCQQLGCKVFCYLTPVNHEAGRRLLGRQFADATASTVAAFQEAAYSEQLPPNFFAFRDWTELLPAGSFFHDLDPTEHLNEEGRTQLADETGKVVDWLLVSGDAAS